uniref:BZIP domain-containing protein n=1 Tax=Parascaris univalens TaxID=6257 RepID=A0A914ZX75_PARUN
MNGIVSPTDSDASSAADTNAPSVSTTAPKKKGGRPRKEDAAQKEQELSSEAKAKRDKRRHDNLLAAARYRQKKDEAIKVLTQQLQARELEVNEKYAKIMEFKNRIEKMESFRQDFSEQLAELKAKWDSELTAIVDTAQLQQTTRTPNATMKAPTTPAKGVLIMPVVRNISTSQMHTYALSSNAIDAALNAATNISSSGIRPPQAIRQIGIGSTTTPPLSPRIMSPSPMKRLQKHLPAEYLPATIHRGVGEQRQPTPPMIESFARGVVAVPLLSETVHSSPARGVPHMAEQASSQMQTAAKLGDMQPPMGQLRLPVVRNNSPVGNNASPDDGVLSFLRLDQPNPYSPQDHMSTSSSSVKEQLRIRTFTHRKGRPRLDETHSGQVLTATNCELEKYSASIMRHQQLTNLVSNEAPLALRALQRCEGSRGVMEQNSLGKPMRSLFSKVNNH